MVATAGPAPAAADSGAGRGRPTRLRIPLAVGGLPWLDGDVATVEGLADSPHTAVVLAGFLGALQRIPGTDAPSGDTRTLADRDAETRAAIARAAGVFGAAAMTDLWQAALDAPRWDRPPVWFHGDFHTIAFTLLSPRSRVTFRTALGVDDATWTRGRGWALTTGLNAYHSYAATNARVTAQTTRQITQALAG